jgi:hypothetical protein
MFENRVLRRIFGSKRDEVMGGWRKLYDEELHNLYSLPSIIRLEDEEDEMGRACSTNGILIGKPEGKRPLRRPRRRWVENIVKCRCDYGRGFDW